MDCFICGGKMAPFLEKDFRLKNLGRCEYERCENCGLVVSKTLYEMPEAQWRALNLECHESYQGTENCDADPRWLERLHRQAEMICELYERGIFSPRERFLDYGCGDGKLADFVNEKLAAPVVEKFDEFMTKPEYLQKVSPAEFGAVMTCSVFEHLIGRRDVEKILRLVKSDGVFLLHTLIAEEIPRDANWFYFLPPHCTFFTNKSMQILYGQYEFCGCAYNVGARMWLMFKDESLWREFCAKDLRGEWALSEKFVEYWKAKPYR